MLFEALYNFDPLKSLNFPYFYECEASANTPQHSCHRLSSGSNAVVGRSDKLNTTSSWPGSLWSPQFYKEEHESHHPCLHPPQLQKCRETDQKANKSTLKWVRFPLLLYLSQLVLERVAAVKFKGNDYLLKTIKLISLNMTCLVSGVYSIKLHWTWFAIQCLHSIYI